MKKLRRVIFKSTGLVLEYEDRTRELRHFYDKNLEFRGRPVSQLDGEDCWTPADYELASLLTHSWHVRWLSDYN